MTTYNLPTAFKNFFYLTWIIPILSAFPLGSTFGQSVTVNPVSGGASVTIPIYTLKYGSISVPVNLSHTESGITVEEDDGDAGLGWNLTCNYGIFRVVRSLPDDLNPAVWGYTGWLYGSTAANVNNFVPTSDDNLATYTDEENDFNTINGLGYTADTEPDLYTVVGPNLNFQFVYDASGVPRLLNYQDVKITPLASAAGFTIQNNVGQTFQFTTAEVVTRKCASYKNATVNMFTTEFNYYSVSSANTSGSLQFAQAWYLTSVTDEAGNVVNFNYVTNNTIAPVTNNNYRIEIASSPDTLYNTSDSFTPQALSSITAGNYSVGFSWTSSKRLTSINVSESGLGDSFQYGFVYQTAQSTTNTTLPAYLHYFLTAINPIFSTSCAPEVPYKFTYQGVTPAVVSYVEMPWKSLYSQDMWGYYNGVTTNENVPQIYFYSAQTDSRRLSFVEEMTGYSVTSSLTGSDRNVNSSKIGIGSLIQINYPTGGYTQIIWERNKYLDSLGGGQVLFAPGQRVVTLISDGGEAAFDRNATASNPYHVIRKDYAYTRSDTDTTSSGLALYPPEYAFATGAQFIRTPYDMSPGSYVAYRRVKEITQGQGARVFSYSLPGMYPATSYSTDWTASKSKFARNPATHLTMTNVQNGYYTFPFAPNPNYGFAQGLLNSQAEYSATGSLVRQKQFYYTRINPALQSVYGLRFERVSDCDCFHFSKYQIITGTTDVLTQQTSTEVSETNSSSVDQVTTYYKYNSDVVNNNFLMDSVRTVYGDGSVSREKITHVKDYAAITSPTSGDVMANAIPYMMSANRQGEVVEQYTTFQPIGATASITGGSLQLFQYWAASGKVYPYQSFTFPKYYTFTPSSVIMGTTQGFYYSPNYILSTSMNDFDAAGNAVSISDNKQNKIGYHNALYYHLSPVASFANATARQTVYEGFEFATGRNLSATYALTYATGQAGQPSPWTGQQSAQLTSANMLYNNSVDNAGTPYRVSCYVNAAQNSTLTFKFANVSGATTTLSYSSSNQWVYLEGLLTVTSNTPTPLQLQITSSATVYIDDILVLPQTATASTQTFLPLKGVTSQTDDRGNSATITYDVLGRKVNTFDRQRNLVELDEYQMKGTPSSFICSYFTYTNPVAGQTFTATIPATCNCFSNAQYQWVLDNVNVGTNSATYTTTVNTPGTHNLKLTVTNTTTNQSGSTTETICFLTNPIAPTFTLINNSTTNQVCPGTPITFTVQNPTTNCGGYTTSSWIGWYYSWNNGTYTGLSEPVYTTSITYSVPSVQGITSFSIKAILYQTCSDNNSQCSGSNTTSTTQVANFTIITCN